MSKKEKIIILMIALLMMSWLIVSKMNSKKHRYAIVTDTINDKVILRFDIEEDAYYEFDVKNGKFHIEVKDGRYRAIDVDCPNQICVNMGWMPSLDYYAPIVCLPNGIMITIEEE